MVACSRPRFVRPVQPVSPPTMPSLLQVASPWRAMTSSVVMVMGVAPIGLEWVRPGPKAWPRVAVSVAAEIFGCQEPGQLHQIATASALHAGVPAAL